MQPTNETYSELQTAYDHFNSELFGEKLPRCLITLQREKNTPGYFSAARFANKSGQVTDEIALNPSYFGVTPLIEIMQTLVHEMVHLWQHHFGNPGRGRYHNEEWASMMERIGLMPSSTGQPGGKRTGDCMADYPIVGGNFLEACRSLLTLDFKLSWYDRFPSYSVAYSGAQSYSATIEDMPEEATSIVASEPESQIVIQKDECTKPEATPAKQTRQKYSCGCGNNIWGKPNLKVVCCECNNLFKVV